MFMCTSAFPDTERCQTWKLGAAQLTGPCRGTVQWQSNLTTEVGEQLAEAAHSRFRCTKLVSFSKYQPEGGNLACQPTPASGVHLALRELNCAPSAEEPASWLIQSGDATVLEVRLGAPETRAAAGTVGVMLAVRHPDCNESVVCMWHPPTAAMLASNKGQVQGPLPLMHKTAHQ